MTTSSSSGAASITPATPLMQQYFTIKEAYPDALLLFQVGDFYEMFYEDARKGAECLAIALTARGKNNGEPIPLCGVPIHARDFYIAKLIRGGYKVALCDQTEPATPGKIVARRVTQVFTPGTLVDDQLLPNKSASYITAIASHEQTIALIFAELLAGTITATVCSAHDERTLEVELSRFFPDEILIKETDERKSHLMGTLKKSGYQAQVVHQKDIDQSLMTRWLSSLSAPHIQTQITNSFALHHAFSLLFSYLDKNQHQINQFRSCSFYATQDFLIIDSITQRNLELVHNNHDGTRAHTLLALLDGATTAMGSRMIKKWLLRPLVNQAAIEQRYDLIDFFSAELTITHQLEKLLKQLGDVERIIGRIALQRATLLDYRQLATALTVIPEIKKTIPEEAVSLLALIRAGLVDLTSLTHLLHNALYQDEATDYIIKDGFSQQLDEMRSLVTNDTAIVCELERREQAITGIHSLKVRYNNIQGYYIEITKTHLALVPSHYIRLQTLVGKERYTTPELKQLEEKILSARADIHSLEQQIFNEIKKAVYQQLPILRRIAQSLAHLDGLFGLWNVAYHRGYTRPIWSNQDEIIIKQGRHPIIEQIQSAPCIPNDVALTAQENYWIITGPNMGGKSTFLRQNALIVLMAQMGSFVPAKSACLSIRDRIFTRIGAHDNVSSGKSTFLVEMEETALICRQATQRSLIILDEIGRGTSTFDGIAIAQAVLEYLATVIKAPTLFATHYHELTQLAHTQPGVAVYCAESIRDGDSVIFTYQIKPGAAHGSFGIDVARLAQLPEPIIQRAQALLATYTNS